MNRPSNTTLLTRALRIDLDCAATLSDTVVRDWKLAKAWLYGELNREAENDA